jgi:hypothetical protein
MSRKIGHPARKVAFFRHKQENRPVFELSTFAIATACGACEKWGDISGPSAAMAAIMRP